MLKIMKMSKLCNIPTKPYTIDDVNKKILAKGPLVHLEHEFLGPQNKYRNEDRKIYESKKQQFCEVAKKYHEWNKMALLNSKTKLDELTNDMLHYHPECECEFQTRNMQCSDDHPNVDGLLLRKRTERRIHQENVARVDVCSMQPWFHRYLKLCKFIYAARAIIMKNRLLKNLEILKQLNRETVAVYETGHRKFENVSYAHIFETFIN